MICLDFWGRKSGPYIQTLHFCLSLGLLVGPLIIDPLSQAKVPEIAQKYLPIPIANMTSLVSSSRSLHIISKREASSLTPHTTVTVDPLLAAIFGSDSGTTTTTSTTTLKTPKPKPVFSDGQKLDNSRDWEKVKIAKPPPEDVISSPSPSSSTSIPEAASNSTPNPKDPSLASAKDLVQSEVDSLENEIKESSHLIEWLKKSQDDHVRVKRQSGGIKVGQGGFGDLAPSLYNNQPRRRHPSVNPNVLQVPQYTNTQMRVPLAPQGPPLNAYQQNYPYLDYDYGTGVAGGRYQNMAANPLDEMPDPPRDVVQAMQKVTNWAKDSNSPRENMLEEAILDAAAAEADNNPDLRGPIQVQTQQPQQVAPAAQPPPDQELSTQQSDSKTKSRKKTTVKPPQKTTSKTSSPSTAEAEKTTESEVGTTKTKHKKPTSSFNNKTDHDVTLKAVLNNIGVSQSNIGFILDASFMWIVSFILMLCMCYRPRRGEPRSRAEADEIFGSRASEENRVFKATVTVLLFFFNLLHWGMFISFSQV